MCILLKRKYRCFDRTGEEAPDHFVPSRLLIQCSAPTNVPLLQQSVHPERILPCLSNLDIYDQCFDFPCPDCRGEPKELDALPHMDPGVDGYLKVLDPEHELKRPVLQVLRPFSDLEAYRANPPVAVRHMAESMAKTLYLWMDEHFRQKLDGRPTQAAFDRHLQRLAEYHPLGLCIKNCNHRLFSPFRSCGCREMLCAEEWNVAAAMRYDMLLQTRHAADVHAANSRSRVTQRNGDNAYRAMQARAESRYHRMWKDAVKKSQRLKAWNDKRRDPEPLWKVEPFRESDVQLRMAIVGKVLQDYLNVLQAKETNLIDAHKSPFSLAYATLRKIGEILAHDTGLTEYRLEATMEYLATHPSFLEIRKTDKATALRRRTQRWPAWIANEHGSFIERLACLINNFADDWADRHMGEFVWDLSHVYHEAREQPGRQYWLKRERYPSRRQRINKYRLAHKDMLHTVKLRGAAMDDFSCGIYDVPFKEIPDEWMCMYCSQSFTDNEPAFDRLAQPDVCIGKQHYASRRCLRLWASQNLNVDEPWKPTCARCRAVLIQPYRRKQVEEDRHVLYKQVQAEFQEKDEIIAQVPRPGLVLEDRDQYGHPLEWFRSPTPEDERHSSDDDDNGAYGAIDDGNRDMVDSEA